MKTKINISLYIYHNTNTKNGRWQVSTQNPPTLKRDLLGNLPHRDKTGTQEKRHRTVENCH